MEGRASVSGEGAPDSSTGECVDACRLDSSDRGGWKPHISGQFLLQSEGFSRSQRMLAIFAAAPIATRRKRLLEASLTSIALRIMKDDWYLPSAPALSR